LKVKKKIESFLEAEDFGGIRNVLKSEQKSRTGGGFSAGEELREIGAGGRSSLGGGPRGVLRLQASLSKTQLRQKDSLADDRCSERGSLAAFFVRKMRKAGDQPGG